MNTITIVKNSFSNKTYTVVIPNEYSPRFSTLKQAIDYAKDLIAENPRFKSFNLINQVKN